MYYQEIKENFRSKLKSSMNSLLSAVGYGGVIGTFGDIVFTVSSQKALTFNSLKRATKARTTSHEVIGAKPIIEFLGPDGEEISFSMQFLASMGINPTKEANKLREMCNRGEVAFFVLDNKRVGDNKWILTDVSESAETVDNTGRIIVSSVDVTLKEYVVSYYEGS